MTKNPKVRVKTKRSNGPGNHATVSQVAQLDAAMARYQELLTLLFKVSPDNPPEEVVSDEKLREAFARVYHPDVVLINATGEELGYEHVLQEYVSYVSDQWRVRLVHIKVVNNVSDDPSVRSFRYVIRADRYNEEAVVRSQAFLGPDGLVIRVERATLASRPKIPGQVTATNTVRVPGLPTEEDLSECVCPAPSEVRGKLLCEGTDLVPVRELYEVIRTRLVQPPSRLPRRQSEIPVHDVEGEALFGGGLVVDAKRVFISKRKEFVLRLDRSPLAVCVRQPHNLHKTYTIYGRQPITDSDKNSGSTIIKSSVTFYPWFRVRDNDHSRLPYLPIYVWDGTDFAPLLRADTAERLRHPRLSPKAVLRSTTGMVLRTKSAGALVREVAGSAAYGLVVPHPDGGCNVTVAPGVDPGMMLCLGLAIGDALRYIH